MGQLFVILMRILFPHDPVARCRELMRTWLRQVMDAVADPEEIESLAYWAEDRAMLEGAICFLEYFMRVLIHGRARQMLDQRHVHIPLQSRPHIRNPASMEQLFRRITQLARDFHNLDALASRQAARMQREGADIPPSLRDSPLRLDVAHQVTSPALCAVEANHRRLASTTSQKWGRWIGASSRRDGGGAPAFARGPPSPQSIADCPLPRSHLRERALTPPAEVPAAPAYPPSRDHPHQPQQPAPSTSPSSRTAPAASR